ncbi:MAG: DeoR/GlpR transcriptional regulator [Clostridia bacterium]|nr:DeoR/GlpR transcriptional regulator [Clostridia bacterium]
MALNDRQKEILELTEKKQRITVAQLAKKLYVSEMTVRRDLAKLEQEGLLRRYHGGAIANQEYLQYPIGLRMHINEKEKRDLAKRAETYIENGQTIFLAASSTCAFLLPCLQHYEGLCVITNSVYFMQVLARMQVRCILAGGEYDATDRELVGRFTERFLRSVNTDIAFLACDGISDNGMVTVEKESGAELIRIGFENAKKRIILADRSKLGNKYTYNICKADEADDIIVI